MERRPLNAPLVRRPLNAPPAPLTRRPLVPPTPPVQAPQGPALAPRTRHPFAGVAPLPVEQWPERVYGYHPLLPPDDVFPRVVCVFREYPGRDIPGFTIVSNLTEPYTSNREVGVTEEVAEAVIRAAWAPDGIVWKRGSY